MGGQEHDERPWGSYTVIGDDTDHEVEQAGRPVLGPAAPVSPLGWGWLHEAAAIVEGTPDEVRARTVAGVAVEVARRHEVRLPDLALLSAWGSPADVAVPDAVPADPWLVGCAFEVLLGAGERRRRGSHFTPRAIAGAVTALALQGVTVGAGTTVCDPAVGGGAFLLAAAEALHTAGLSRREVVGRLSGVDVDPAAAAVTEVGLALWAGGRRPGAISAADALSRPEEAWGASAVVVGNPPFLGQLRTATARPPDRSGLRPDLAALAGPYTDAAALFAALAVGLVHPGGRVALVLPRSFLVARDAGAARAATLGSAALDHVWLPGGRVFGAAVDVCVPVWQRRGGGGPSPSAGVDRSTGVPPTAAAPAAPPPAGSRTTWSHLLAGLGDTPAIPSLDRLRAGGVLGDVCSATAGFRDQYYGLIPFTVDDPDGRHPDATHAPLVTSGLIDPAASAWGRRTTRYAGRRWEAPRVDLAAVATAGGALARWTTAKRVPKLLVAAQTRAIEAVADVDGTWLPSTPVATVVPAAAMRWHVLAVLLGPVATAWVLQRHRGSGLSPDAIRLPPSAIRAIPTPADRETWDVAASHVRAASTAVCAGDRAASLSAAAAATCAAYGLPPGSAVEWWQARQPVV